MYLRTTKRKRTDGTEVAYYQLAENVWDPARGCAVARVVHSFGRADQLDGQALRRLAGSILRICSGEEQVAAVEGVKVTDSWPFGAVWVLEQVWRQLGIPDILAQFASQMRSRLPFERALFAMVANRARQPYSKLHCWEKWLAEEAFVPGTEHLRLEHLYRSMDLLEHCRADIEKAVYFAAADLTNADVDVIFYDTSSLHFEIDEEDETPCVKQGRRYEAQRKRGKSKNGRSDAPQIVIGLAVTRDGLPVRSWVMPGNTADVTTVEKVKKDLRGWKLGRCVFVGDAGMNSEQNRRTLSRGNGKYILASRTRAGDEVTKEVMTRAGRYHPVAGNLRIKEVLVGEGERRRRYVVCHNPQEVERQRRHRDKLLGQLAAELESLRAAPEGHSKRMCELLSSERFGRYLRRTAEGSLAIDRAAAREAARYDGKWVVTSNDDTLTAEDLALGYKQLMRVEECWRTLKSGLRMRPVFHWTAWRISAHVAISVLALLLERIVEQRADDTWRNVADVIDTIKVVEYTRDGVRVRQTTELRPTAVALLQRIGCPVPPKVHRVEQVAAAPPAPVPAADPPA